MTEVPPARRRGASLALAALAAAAPVVFFAPLLFGGALAGGDWASHHFEYFDWVRVSLTRFGTLPLYMARAWVVPNFLANAEAPQLGPLVWLLLWLPTGGYIKLLIALFCAAGLLGMLALLRDLRVALPVALFSAVGFGFGGFFVAHLSAGHPWALGGYLLPGLVCLFRRALGGSRRALVGAAALDAVAILGGQHQPFVWQNLFLSLLALAWAVRDRSARPLLVWGATALLAAGLAAVKLLPMLAEFADYDPVRRTAGLPPGLLLRSLAGAGQGPGTAPPGLAFAHGSGWWEWAFYAGPLGLAGLLVGLSAARRCAAFALVGGFFLLIALDWAGPLAALDPWARLQELPLWRTQRSPSRFLFPALFGLSVTAAAGLDRVFRAARARRPRAAAAAAAALTLLLFADLRMQSEPWQRAAVGAPLPARDPRPRPLRIRQGPASAELTSFAPNRLVYRVRASRPARLRLPLRLREGTREWRVVGAEPLSVGGSLAVEVPAGERELTLTYRPRGFRAGLAVSAVSLLAVGALRARRR